VGEADSELLGLARLTFCRIGSWLGFQPVNLGNL
jgi:hypothetical protein